MWWGVPGESLYSTFARRLLSVILIQSHGGKIARPDSRLESEVSWLTNLYLRMP